MTAPKFITILWLPLSIFLLCATAAFYRPLLPIDETRYMSVAWEMYLRHGWFEPLTMNFEPYHHKPPLLFWMINLFWAVFGVSRWSALISFGLTAIVCVYLTSRLAQHLFPELAKDKTRTQLIIAACAPFMIYSTLIMFDMTLTVFVLLSLLSLLHYEHERRLRTLVFLGLAMGFGVLTKGPVAYLYVVFPLLLAPYWVKGFQKPASWYTGCVLAFAISVLPVLFWLIPVLSQSDHGFATSLLWNQTAGRVTGSLGNAHTRPFYFYLPLVPVMLIPWIFFPAFWRGMNVLSAGFLASSGNRFLLCWLAPVFISFCLISGKQPHYLLPLLPGIAIVLTLCLQKLRTQTLALTFSVMLALFVIGQIIASASVFKAYDLQPIASYVQANPDHDWAYFYNYHAEFGFLARLQKPMEDMEKKDLLQWFKDHPDGLAVVYYKDDDSVAAYMKILDIPSRDKRLGIFSAKKPAP